MGPVPFPKTEAALRPVGKKAGQPWDAAQQATLWLPSKSHAFCWSNLLPSKLFAKGEGSLGWRSPVAQHGVEHLKLIVQTPHGAN